MILMGQDLSKLEQKVKNNNFGDETKKLIGL